MEELSLTGSGGVQPPLSYGHPSKIGEERPGLGENKILSWCVAAGAHPNEDEGWFMLFKFPNGLTATVAWTLQTDGIEVGVRNGDWLVDVIPNLSGDEIRAALEEVMRRSI
jgi:hypothetical protein